MRIDKWLWVARFYKTRSLASEEVGKGRVHINGQATKPSREVKAGDVLWLRGLDGPRTVTVRGISLSRGPASEAQRLYEETAESLKSRLAAIEQRRLAPEPAHTITHGRPSKRDRRNLEDHQANTTKSWDERWSASADR
jgi:ribosome-associated heat shock protein Hsp15